FIQLVGKSAEKNVILLNEEDAKKFAARRKIKIKVRIKKGYVIAKYKNHILGTGTYDGFYLHPKVKEKRKRKIENSIK
ncbi:hypothetical protein JXB01_01425, partial [Candidatus Micrarchaeota archaeon]|nr:hypothetical protein [Candidatus Micrarchaeota archaeon]